MYVFFVFFIFLFIFLYCMQYMLYPGNQKLLQQKAKGHADPGAMNVDHGCNYQYTIQRHTAALRHQRGVYRTECTLVGRKYVSQGTHSMYTFPYNGLYVIEASYSGRREANLRAARLEMF